MNEQENQDKKESPETTMKMIECGDLALDREIEHGIFLLGDTKAGKTTSAHYLTQAILQGIEDPIYGSKYQVQQSFNMQAKIGITTQS